MRYRAFDRLSSGAAQRQIIRDRGPFQRHGRYGCGLDDHLPTAPRASKNFFKLFLGRDARKLAPLSEDREQWRDEACPSVTY